MFAKSPLSVEGVYDPCVPDKISTLFSGTTIVQTQHYPNANRSTALVTATRTNSEKGRLIRKILFPSTMSFDFNEQLKLVFCLLLLWGLVLMGFGIW